IVPILTLCAGVAVDAAAKLIARLVRSPRLSVTVLTALGSVLLVAPSAAALVKVEQRDTTPSTGVAARRWIDTHVRPGSRIVREIKTAGLDHSPFRVTEWVPGDPHSPTVAALADAGDQYLLVTRSTAETLVARSDRARLLKRFSSTGY